MIRTLAVVGDLAAAAVPRRQPVSAAGRSPALVDSGFVGHAGQTADWVQPAPARGSGRQHPLARRPRRRQRDPAGTGRRIAASVPDADAVTRRDPAAARPSTSTSPLPRTPSRATPRWPGPALGDAEWQVIATPGHTPGHCACGSPTNSSSSSATPCPTTTSAGSTSPSTDPVPPRPHSLPATPDRPGPPRADPSARADPG